MDREHNFQPTHSRSPEPARSPYTTLWMECARCGSRDDDGSECRACDDHGPIKTILFAPKGKDWRRRVDVCMTCELTRDVGREKWFADDEAVEQARREGGEASHE